MRLREFFMVEETRDEVVTIASKELPNALPLLTKQTGLDPNTADLSFSDWGELRARFAGKTFEWNAITNRWERYGK